MTHAVAFIRSAVAAIALVAGAAHAAIPVPIVNGSFEVPFTTGNSILPGGSTFVTGWTTVFTGVEHFNATGYGGAFDGQMIVDLANYVYSTGGIEQSFATTIGTEYTATFALGNYLGFGRDGTGIVNVSAAGSTATFSTAVATTGSTTWSTASFTFTANDTTTTLRFWNEQNANQHFAFVDGVGVTAAVPEPGTWAMLASGLALLGVARHRSRRGR